MKWGAVIVAAGRGTAVGRPKQLIEIAGCRWSAWSMRTFAAMPEIARARRRYRARIDRADVARSRHDSRPTSPRRVVRGGVAGKIACTQGHLRDDRRVATACSCTTALARSCAAVDVRGCDARSARGRGVAAWPMPVVDTIKRRRSRIDCASVRTLDRGRCCGPRRRRSSR